MQKSPITPRHASKSRYYDKLNTSHHLQVLISLIYVIWHQKPSSISPSFIVFVEGGSIVGSKKEMWQNAVNQFCSS